MKNGYNIFTNHNRNYYKITKENIKKTIIKGENMLTESRIYVKKFLSVLYLKNIKEVPFSGETFEKGINSMKNYLEETFSQDEL